MLRITRCCGLRQKDVVDSSWALALRGRARVRGSEQCVYSASVVSCAGVRLLRYCLSTQSWDCRCASISACFYTESESKFGPHTVTGDSSLQSSLTERFCFLTEPLCEVMGICSEPSPQFLGCHLTLSDALFFCPFYVSRNKQKL